MSSLFSIDQLLRNLSSGTQTCCSGNEDCRVFTSNIAGERIAHAPNKKLRSQGGRGIQPSASLRIQDRFGSLGKNVSSKCLGLFGQERGQWNNPSTGPHGVLESATDSQAGFNKLFDSIPDLACVVSPDGFFRRLNPAWEQSLGFTRETIFKTPMLKLIHPDDLGRTLSEVAKQGPLYKTKSFVNRYRCQDGTYRNFNWSTTFNSQESTRFGIARDVTDQELADKARREMVLQIAHAANHDHLTGLANRKRLDEWLMQEVDASDRARLKFSVLFLDLDGFKQVNDSLGHSIGDKLLCSIADRLVATVSGCGIVARLGGDEFIIVLREMDQTESVDCISARLLRVVAEQHSIDGHKLHITASIGVSLYPDDGVEVETLIRNADSAMYRAKRDGRRNWRAFTDV